MHVIPHSFDLTWKFNISLCFFVVFYFSEWQFTISSLLKKESWPSKCTLPCCHYFYDTLKVAFFNCQHISFSMCIFKLFIAANQITMVISDSLTIGCLFLMWKVVFIVMLFLWSFLVALLYRGVVFYPMLHKYVRWNRATVGVLWPLNPSLLLISLSWTHCRCGSF